MVQIAIETSKKSYLVKMTKDGEFKCAHEDVDVEEPCCSTKDKDGLIQCGCEGSYTVYCNNCRNEDMTQSESDTIVENYVKEEI